MEESLRKLELGRPVEAQSWADLVFKQLDVNGDREALVFPERRVTYRQFADGIVGRARSMLATGARPGDHVGILMGAAVDYLECFFAVAAIGCVAVLINSRYRAHELAYVIADSEITLLLVGDKISRELDFSERLFETFPELRASDGASPLALAAAPRLKRIVTLGESGETFVGRREFEGAGRCIAVADVHRLRQQVRVRDPFLMMYTSGTTSMPKGCLLSHEAVTRTAQNYAVRLQLGPDDRFWSPLPLFHMGAVNPLGATLCAAGTFICSPVFDPDEALATLERERVTVAFLGFPAIINGLTTHPKVSERDLSRLRAMSSSIASYPTAVRDRLLHAFPRVTQTGVYGMTETSGACTATAVYDGPEAGLRAVGRPMPGMRVRVVREDGSEAAPGEVGEILIRGYGTFSGYHNAPEKTAETLRDGWVHSGDLGCLNEFGELLFKSRVKDMLKVGGENVAAAEIEEFLHAHDAVKLCQVVGVPDERLGEVAAAFIELREGAAVTEQEIIRFCRGRIASFKVPRFVRFVREWPLTASAKVKKSALAEKLTAELAAKA